MAKDKVKTETAEVVEIEVPEVYTGNVYEFNGGITITGNSGPVTVTVNLQGIPNNPPPKPGTGNP